MGRPRRKPTAATLHKEFVGLVDRPAPRGSVRLMLNGIETPVHAQRPPGESFEDRVQRHQGLLSKRGVPMAAEHMPPIGQAALWYADVILCVPRSGRDVARQVARLCGDDSQVTLPIRSLADAVGVRDKSGRDSAYTRRGIECLVESGWLRTETEGSGRGSVTTLYLMPGDRFVEWYPTEDDDAWQDWQDSVLEPGLRG